LDTLPYLETVGHIADSISQQPPPPLPWTDTFPGAGASLKNYIAEPLERDAQCCLERNLQNNPYCPFVTCEEYKYIECGNKKMGMKTYYDNVQREVNTTLRLSRIKNAYGVQKLVTSQPDDQALGEWEYMLSRI
jgi:hypothetical protein